MLKTADIRVIYFLIVNTLFVFVFGAVNDMVCPWVYMMMPAVFVAPAALFLNMWGMALVVAYSALLTAAGTPANGGWLCFVWLLCAFLLHGVRFRFMGREFLSLSLMAQGVNALCIVVASFGLPMAELSVWEHVCRLFADTFASGVFLAVFGVFVFRMPAAILGAFGVYLSIAEGD